MKKLILSMMLVVLAGCGKPPVDPNIAACPEKTILVLQQNQRFMESIKVGTTSAADLKSLKGLKREATLVRRGESMDVLFYQTGLPRCPWLVWGESLTPVVVNNGIIVAFGGQTVRDMAAQGWEIKEAKWPWQRYDFGYIPVK